MWKKILFLIITVFYINSISAQKTARKIEITGSVRDVYNGPIVNAMIMIDDKKTNSVTDSRGNFKIRVKPGASTIRIVTFGNGTFQEYINGRTRINFNFSTIANQPPDLNNWDGEQGVNTGYGLVKKKNLTNNVSKIDGSHKNYTSYSSVSEMIQREVSGVRVYGNDLIIQGSQNLDGLVYPLIVVDGVYMNHIPDIPPVTVQSIEVLKGGSAAIYGSRAMGGAIIIKTKIQND